MDAWRATDAGVDALLAARHGDPFALLVGMLLDQQMPMERAFLGPWRLAQRMKTPRRLDVARIAAYDPDQFVEDMGAVADAVVAAGIVIAGVSLILLT